MENCRHRLQILLRLFLIEVLLRLEMEGFYFFIFIFFIWVLKMFKYVMRGLGTWYLVLLGLTLSLAKDR